MSTIIPKTQHKSFAHMVASRKTCLLCKKDHSVSECNDFLKYSVEKKYQIIKANGLYLNRLRISHHVYKNSTSKWRKCYAKHHILLHRNNRMETNNQLSLSTQVKDILTERPVVPSSSQTPSSVDQTVNYSILLFCFLLLL